MQSAAPVTSSALAALQLPPTVQGVLAARIDRLIAFGTRFEDATHYTTLLLGDFTGRDVKRVIRRTIAESLLRRDAPDTAGWPRE